MVAVTNAEFWQRVGEYLLIHRTRLGWDRHTVKKKGGPDGKTVEAVECGTPGRISSLEGVALVYDLALPDIFRAVLDAEAGKAEISAEAMQLLRRFESMSVDARQALLIVAKALPDETQPVAP